MAVSFTDHGSRTTPPAAFFAPVMAFLGPKVWLAGGSIVRWLEGAKINEGDFDLFTDDPDGLSKRLTEDADCFLTLTSDLAYSHETRTANIQVIRRPYLSMESVIDSFDFTARMLAYDGTNFIAGMFTLEHIEDKLLVFNSEGKSDKMSFSLTSLTGLVKYGNRGYTLDFKNARLFLEAWGCQNVLMTAY